MGIENKDRPIDTTPPSGSLVMTQLYPSMEVLLAVAPLHTAFSVELVTQGAQAGVIDVFDANDEGHLRIKALNGTALYRIWRYRPEVGVIDGVRVETTNAAGLVTPSRGGDALRGITLSAVFA